MLYFMGKYQYLPLLMFYLHFVLILISVCFLSQGRIKKIMQSDEEVGKVAQAVPIIIYILFKQNCSWFFILFLLLEKVVGLVEN